MRQESSQLVLSKAAGVAKAPSVSTDEYFTASVTVPSFAQVVSSFLMRSRSSDVILFVLSDVPVSSEEWPMAIRPVVLFALFEW